MESLRTQFFIMLKEYGEIEAVKFQDPAHAKEVTARFEEELRGVKFTDMDCIDSVCCRLLTRARYYYTSAEKILSDIEAITKDKPQLPVKEAALFATINYVVDYVTDQIQKK